MLKITRRLISVAIAICAVCILLSSYSFAENYAWDCPECGRTGNTGNFCGGCAHPAPWLVKDRVTIATTSEALTVGSSVLFGQYEQDESSDGTEDIEWIVLEMNDETALLLCKYSIDAKQYNSDYQEENVTWETCSLRKWLNEDFYNAAFSSEERSKIITSNLKMDDNPQYGTKGGNDTKDYVFLLSFTEARQYLASNELRICYGTKYTNRISNDPYTPTGSRLWWLRTPGYFGQYSSVIYYDGELDTFGDYVNKDMATVRPAIRIRLNVEP